MARTVLTAPTSFYCNSNTAPCPTGWAPGSPTNTGLSQTSPLVQPQDVINLLQTQYDLGFQPVDIYGADGQQFDGFSVQGLLVGQNGPLLTFHCGSNYGASSIVPKSQGAGIPGSYGIGLSWGAMLRVTNIIIDSTQQVAAGSQGNDCIALGQGARLQLVGSNKLIQNALGFNHLTLDANCTIDMFPDASGSGHLHFAGRAQCGMQLDAASAFQADCNFAHGILAMWADAWNGAQPYWADAFVDVATASKALLAGIDFHGPGTGYQYRIREGGTLDLNLANDPGELSPISNTSLFGSASTAWPVQGYLV